MKPSILVFTLFTVAGAFAAPDGFTPLFNGKDLSGWWGCSTEDPSIWMALPKDQLAAKKQASLSDIHAHWREEKGTLVNDGKGLFLTTDKNFSDFELTLEYKTVARADSGVYLRGIPQVQIWDFTEEKKFKLGANKGSGGLWNNPEGTKGIDPIARADRPFGEWNKLHILMVGEYVTVHLNGQLVVDHARLHNFFNKESPIPRSGPIQLQTHGGQIGWRNIFIREIEGEEANRILSSKGVEEFDSAYDGKSSTGWKGAVDSHGFEDGVIQCLKGKGGNLLLEKEFSDFAVRFEFKVPPGGNNGLAIRYPGNGDPAYSGMCELQVLDDSAQQYAKLDARQYHGSAYGMVAAHRGYQREVGEWNFQTVEVKGTKIRVELNGTQILDCDLSLVTEFKGNRNHSKDRTKGYFGFAGHKSPVAFRNIFIKELNHEK